MAFNPLEWFRAQPNGTRRESLKRISAGLFVWLMAWLVVWWNQDARDSFKSSLSDRQRSAISVFSEQSKNPADAPEKVKQLFRGDETSGALLSGVGTLVGMGLFWGGGLLLFRPLAGWGLCQTWVVRCGSVERLALAIAAGMTLLAILTHWLYSHIYAWMLAAVVGLIVLVSAMKWSSPGTKPPPQ